MSVTSNLLRSARIRGVAAYLLLLGAAIVVSLVLSGSMAAGRTSGAATGTRGMADGLVEEAIAGVATAVQRATARMLETMIDAVLDAFRWITRIARELLVLPTVAPLAPLHSPTPGRYSPIASDAGTANVVSCLQSVRIGGTVCF